MVRRGRDPSAGSWSIPGGKLELGESLHDGVIREVREETGAAVQVRELVGVDESISDYGHHVIVCFRADPVGQIDCITAGDDADAVLWMPIPEVLNLELVGDLGVFLVDNCVIPARQTVRSAWSMGV